MASNDSDATGPDAVEPKKTAGNWKTAFSMFLRGEELENFIMNDDDDEEEPVHQIDPNDPLLTNDEEYYILLPKNSIPDNAILKKYEPEINSQRIDGPNFNIHYPNKTNSVDALIVGENLNQVASQLEGGILKGERSESPSKDVAVTKNNADIEGVSNSNKPQVCTIPPQQLNYQSITENTFPQTEHQIVGPYVLTEVASLMKQKLIHRDTKVFGPGFNEWEPISNLDWLSEFLFGKPENCETRQINEKRQRYRQRRKAKKEEGWWINVQPKNTVYVKGLPHDITVAELQELAASAGTLRVDPQTLHPRIKIYRGESNSVKGDATISYAHPESAEMALKYIHGRTIRGHTIHMELAEFQKKEERLQQDNTIKRKRLIAAKKEEERKTSWADGILEGAQMSRIVIIYNCFTEDEAKRYKKGDQFYNKLAEKVKAIVPSHLRVERVTVIPRNMQGVICIKFKTSEEAEEGLEYMKKASFRTRPIEVYMYNGKTDFKANCFPEDD